LGNYSELLEPSLLLTRLEDSDWRVVDCRFDLMNPSAGRKAYLDSHIPGAVYADLDHDLAAPVTPHTGRHPLPEPDVLAARFAAFGIDSKTQVVVYDDSSGAMAARAWWLLRWLGHKRVALLNRGFAHWQSLDLPLESGPVAVAPRAFSAAPRPDVVVGTVEVAAAVGAIADLLLVDARDPARFRGEVEPIDAVAGHIPGAVNLPFSASLDSGGGFKSAAELSRLWAKVLGDDREVAWTAMCGSGVTACHLAFSALLAGYAEPRLYAGSWSEWIRDPRRPIATGAL
jgi:thiosulfate/3-mercaptopyruvate sulfurtransferase